MPSNNYKKKSKAGAAGRSAPSQPSRNSPLAAAQSSRSTPDYQWPFLPVSQSSDPAQLKCSAAEFERWCTVLCADIPSEYHRIIHEQLCDAIAQAEHSLSPSSTASRDLFNFLQAHPNAKSINENWKVAESAPSARETQPRSSKRPSSSSSSCSSSSSAGGRSLLSYSGVGFQVNTGRKRCPDDDIYKQFEPLQRNLPRGLVFIREGPPSDQQAPVRLALFGNRKFFGRQRGDDDDSDLCSTSLSLEFASFLNSTKANGECCQVVWDEGHQVWLIGSKNRKLVSADGSDLEQYKKEPTYGFATEMAACFFRTLHALSAEHVRDLKAFLHLSKLTLNFEFESPAHQHIVSLSEERLVLIGASGIHLRGRSLHPIFATALGRFFRFPSVLDDLSTYPRSKLDDVCQGIARGWNTEGSVLVLLDANHLVLDLIKVKAWWYVLLRAIREKLRHMKPRDPDSLQLVVRSIQLRLQQLEVDMSIPSPIIQRYSQLGTRFARWLSETLPPYPTKQVGGPALKDRPTTLLIDHYPTHWLNFLRANELPSDPSLVLGEGYLSEAASSSLTLGEPDDLPILLLMQGIPGSGKSSVAAKAVEVLQSRGITATQLAQDDFADLGTKASSSACFDTVRELLVAKNHRVVILARNNANAQQFGKYLQFDSYLAHAVFFCPSELFEPNPADFLYMCIASVLNRKHSGEEHPTNVMSAVSLAALPLRFLHMLHPDPGALRVPLMNPGPHPTPQSGELCGLSPNDLTGTLIHQLNLTDPEHLLGIIGRYHRDLNAIASELADEIQRIMPFPLPSYKSFIGAILDAPSVEQLVQLTMAHAPSTWDRVCHHLTLMHSSDFAQNPALWKTLLGELKQPVVIQVSQLIVTDRVLFAEAVLLDPAMAALVSSGHPHVTMSLLPSTSSVESLRVLQRKAAGLVQPRVIPLDAPLQLSAHIQLIAQSGI